MIDYNDYIFGGYFVTKAAFLPPYLDSTLLPVKVVTVSHCITDVIPDVWAFDWSNSTFEERLEEAQKFSITPDEIDKVIK